nr:hypothetical protein [Tanacetum cinerariifolium]
MPRVAGFRGISTWGGRVKVYGTVSVSAGVQEVLWERWGKRENWRENLLGLFGQGVKRSLSLVEFGWRVGLYSVTEGGKIGTVLALKNAAMVKDENRLLQFWSTIKDGEFTIGSMDG